jgi:hypothetical protein
MATKMTSGVHRNRCVAAMLNDPTVILVHQVREGVDCHLRPLGIVARPHSYDIN